MGGVLTSSKRVVRTYSKRDNSNSTSTSTSTSTTPNLSERPAKRQRTESIPDLPALLHADSEPMKPKRKHSTIDAYFSSTSTTASSSSARGPWLSSDTVFGSRDDRDDAEYSPPSSPPVRRWTSPRRLKFRPSLGPIAGNDERETAMKEGKGKRSAERDDGEGYGSRRLRLGSEERVEDETVVAVPGTSGDVGLRGCDSADARDEGWLGRGATQRMSPSAGHSTTLKMDTGSVKRKYADATGDDHDAGLPPTPESQTSPPETTAPRHDATKATSVPTYTMPYKFYLTAQQSRPSPPTTAAAAKRPARTIQTTLNLSTKQPFKECKLCDTVFNPLHATDVRLHQARHAKLVAGKR